MSDLVFITDSSARTVIISSFTGNGVSLSSFPINSIGSSSFNKDWFAFALQGTDSRVNSSIV